MCKSIFYSNLSKRAGKYRYLLLEIFGKDNFFKYMKGTNLMKIIILFFTFFVIIIEGEKLSGQDEITSKELERINASNAYSERQERHYERLLNNYKITEGDKNKKNEEKRVVLSKMDIELPYNLMLRYMGAKGKFIVRDESHKNYLEPNSTKYYHCQANISSQ
jgi:hypothetical protein